MVNKLPNGQYEVTYTNIDNLLSEDQQAYYNFPAQTDFVLSINNKLLSLNDGAKFWAGKDGNTVTWTQGLSTKVNVSDMRKPANQVAGIDEVNAKQDKIGYTPSDDSKVAHLSGANNFDTVPTVNNNPLLLASSLPSDLARTGQDTNFTGKLQKSGIDVATKSDVTTAISTATANTVGIDPNTSQITNTTVKANAGQILIGGQPAISLVQSDDDATALTDSSNDAILHFTVEE